MDVKKTEEWLKNEANEGNALARSYLSLLENANPEIKKHWIEQMSVLLDAAGVINEEMKKASKLEK